MDPSKSSFAKLTGTSNYQVWSIKMKSYLISQDLWEAIDILPSRALEPDLKSINSKAISLIILSCEDHIIRLLDPNDLAVNAWKKLEKQYGQVGFSARHLAFQSLISTHISSCESIDHFIDQFRSNMNTLSQITTSTLPQWLLLSIFINNVSSQYEAWAQSLMQEVRSKDIPEYSESYLDEVIASLIDEARRISHSKENNSTAMTARKPPKAKPICKYCGKIHKSDNCYQQFPEKRPSARMSTTTNAESTAQGQSQQNQLSPSNIAFLSQNDNQQCHTWILDSGATQHMCNEKSQFQYIEPYSTTITIANNSKMNATGKGDVRLTTRDGTSFTLVNVLYVPKLASNLLSVCCATRNPHTHFNFINGECQIKFKGNLLAIARQQNSLLVLETVKPINSYAHISKSISSLTWHKRLGHVNEDFMGKETILSQIGAVEKFHCETCLKNKSTRIISRKPVVKASRPLEKIHSDLTGPITPTSLGGNKYVITFTDDYSRFSWVFPCNEKSRCLEVFKVFKKAVENEFNQKIAFLHCDNGGEYTSNSWKHFAQQEGFQIIYTVPHTPEQNGVAERLNRTLFNMARCFLNDSKNLTKQLWAELIRTACYIKNRLPSSSNEHFKSSFEILFNRQPSINHLRVIGSNCYINKTGKIIGKLDERAYECILVGYESENVFRVYDPLTMMVSRSRDVVIKEDIEDRRDMSQRSDSVEVRADKNVYVDLNQDKSHSTQRTPITPTVSPGHEKDQTQYYTADTFPESELESSIDELADPQYDLGSYIPRAFVSKCLVAADSPNHYVPETLEQALRCQQSKQWAHSMRDEIKSILENNTWKLVPAPLDGSKVIQGRWVFRTKTDVNGNPVKCKARWVVRGFQQEEGCNFTDTFASVVKPMSYKILFAIAASDDLEIEQMDVKTAFLNSPIQDDVYVEQPHGFEIQSVEDLPKLSKELQSNETLNLLEDSGYPKCRRARVNLVCKLNRALYGLKQAPRAWYETLMSFLATIDLAPLRSDYAVFVNQNRTIFVAVYVDDILIFGKDIQQIKNVKNHLHHRFQMSDMGQAHLYLGMQISRDRRARNINVNQQNYIKVILERFNMIECNSVSTPMETGLKLCKRTDSASPNEITHFQQLMGCLEYAAIMTRPDIAFSVHRLAQFASNPDISHLNAAKRILRYLKGTMKFGLVFNGNQVDKLTLVGYSDADWASSSSERKSIGGYCFYLNNCLISHMSKKQKTIALSTAESETHAAVQATKEAIWLRNILEEMGFKQNTPTTIFCDNQAAIALSRNPEYHARSKHVDIQYYFLRHHVDKKTVELKFIRSDQMAADGLTKPLTRQKHIQFCDYMQGYRSKRCD